MVRALILGLVAYLGIVASAGACSCIAESPGSRLNRSDAAFVGKVQSFRDEGATRIYTVAVEKVYKGNIGATAEVRGNNPDDGAATSCDEYFTVGQELGGFFNGAPEEWRIFTCNRASRDELDRAAAENGQTGNDPPKPAPPVQPAPGDPAPKPAFIARGPFGDSPFAITDGAGKPIVYAPAEAERRLPGTFSLSPCPGGRYLLDDLTIRRVGDLVAVGVLGNGGKAPQEIRCIRADGQAAVGFTRNFAGSRGELGRFQPGSVKRLAKGPWAMAALGDRRSALAAIQPGGTLVLVDNATGSRRIVRRANRNCVDLEFSPDQRKIAETVSRRGRERVGKAFIHDLVKRTSLERFVDGYDFVWFAKDGIASVTYDNHARIYDARLRPKGARFLASDGGTFGAWGDLWWIRDGALHMRGADSPPAKLELAVRGPLIPIGSP
jgi:hypothetical protein